MDQLKTLFRAFSEYRKNTIENKGLKRQRKAIIDANIENDTLESIKFLVTIEEEWVAKIEAGLVFVGNAVQEQRQFITSNGEVIPIEKVKKVSKASVEHLAKHSNLITRVPEEDKEVIPDKLFMVEKLSDFAIYENRFLYMLLVYLKDFIQLRLDKIKEMINTYQGNLLMDKKIHTKTRTIQFELKFFEERKDSPYSLLNDESKNLIERIETINHIVSSLLATDLMVEVSKAPMVKPPIVKTNVLRMNNNFRNALALYDYVSSYRDKGYSVEEVKKTYQPFPLDTAEEVSELVSLTSFLTYEYGNDLKPELKKLYDLEEKERKILESKKIANQIQSLKRRIEESGEGVEEYMLLLEKRNHFLEQENTELENAKTEADTLKKENEELKKEKKELNKQISGLNKIVQFKDKEIDRLNQKYITDMQAVEQLHELQLEKLKDHYLEMIALFHQQHILEIDAAYERFEQEKAELLAEFEREKQQLQEEFEKEKEEIQKEYEANLEQIQNDFENQFSLQQQQFEEDKSLLEERYEVQISELNSIIANHNEEKEELAASYDSQIDELNEKIEQIEEEKRNQLTDCQRQIQENKLLFQQQFEEDKNELERHRQEMDSEYEKLENQYQSLLAEKRLISAQLHGIRQMNGVITEEEDYTSKERFEELENEFVAFADLFDDQWKKAKKVIRKNILWAKMPKKQKNKEEPLEQEMNEEESLVESIEEEKTEDSEE